MTVCGLVHQLTLKKEEKKVGWVILERLIWAYEWFHASQKEKHDLHTEKMQKAKCAILNELPGHNNLAVASRFALYSKARHHNIWWYVTANVEGNISAVGLLYQADEFHQQLIVPWGSHIRCQIAEAWTVFIEQFPNETEMLLTH